MSVFLKSVMKSSFGIFTSRIFGLIRDIAVAAFFGANALTDAFFVAYAIPNLFRAFFAEGALTSAFIPFLSDNMAADKKKAFSYLTSMMIVLFVMVTSIVILISMFPKQIIFLFMPGYLGSADILATAGDMLRLVMPYLVFITLCGLFTGYLYLHNSYYVPYSSTALLNISMIAGAYAGYKLGGNIMWLCYGVILGGVLQLLYIFTYSVMKGFRFRWDGMHPDVGKTFRLLVPSLAGLGINQLYFTLGRIIASFLAAGSISYLYYADRIFQLPLGVFSIAVGAVSLTEISKANTAGNFSYRNTLIDKAFIAIFVIIMPATLGLVLLADEITALIYARNQFTGVDVYNTAQALVMFSVGMIFFSYTGLLAKVFFSEKDMRTPVKGAFIGLCVYAVSNIILIKPFGHAGIALASGVSASANSFYLYSKLRDYRFNFRGNAALLVKIIFACFIMGACAVGMSVSGVHLLINIPVAALLYFAVLKITGVNVRKVLR
ncbi:murein biosynthesis integral membrane protein MurJ [Geovibrio thiophilus]|uniref:Probable lipid II flippase MurJ n=1 Tax=Geovibrio thiophilus TaxID=139438 RepID=A0A3R5XXL7_9BACT|nr:murein biosynthesis integral membrane protein MurJ [Geovibrio thiophilus]QAR33254.1 murein biosynthesis integral membrane protein MurJ [Geovibrio thiophilus]